jgi:hypothetical protein
MEKQGTIVDIQGDKVKVALGTLQMAVSLRRK